MTDSKHPWRLLWSLSGQPRLRFASLVVASALAAGAESAALALIAEVALGDISQGTRGELPFLSGLSTRQQIWIALALACIMFVLHVHVGRSIAKMSAATLAGARRSLLDLFARSTWEAQSKETEGRLHESFTTLSIQTSVLTVLVCSSAAAASHITVLAGVSLVVNPLVTVAVGAAGAVLFAALRPVGGLTRKRANAYIAQNASLTETTARFTGMTLELRTFGVLDVAADDVARQSDRVAERVTAMRTATRFGTDLYRDIAIVAVIVSAALIGATTSGVATGSGVVILLALRSLLYASTLQSAIQSLREQRGNLEELSSRLDQLRASTRRPGHVELDAFESLEASQLGFSYRAEAAAFEDIEIDLRPGESLAVVGQSGSGKSTLLAVLRGLLPPTSGKVWLNGHDIDTVSNASLAKMMAIVPQEPQLVSGSLRDNIVFYRDGITAAAIDRAIRLADLEHLVAGLPDGIATQLGPSGSGLSGGQKQRVALARALVGEPDVLILDEPTSALDTEAESRFLDTIEHLRGGITIVLVSHSAQVSSICERQLVLGQRGERAHYSEG